MSTTISSELNQGYRSALLAYYIGQYAPNSGDTTLSNMIKTSDDVYEYLLIDPLVTNDVQTSRVAQAMSSIQQYINSIALNMEPGYNTQALDATQLKRWNNGADQYAVWGGYVELDSYPENYIDPTLRQDQTSCFNDLITQLNQKTVSNDSAQQAVMGYLNQFEQVANLTIVSGYTTDKDQTKGIYYLLGKSTSSPVQYYWRSFDMSLNVDNVVASNAWSEWYPINTSINDALIQGTPRLAYFNNRLYLFWFERAEGNGPNESDTITAYSSQCDFSRNWSSPYTMMSIDSDTANHQGDQTYCDKLFTSGYLCTACGYNQTDNYLVVSLYDGTDVKAYTDNGYNDFTITIDYWFNTEKKEAKVSTGMTNILSKFLYNYIESQTITNNQRKIQSCFLVDKFYVADVKCDSTKFYDGLHSYITLPTLNTSNFSVNTADDGSITLVGTITTACNTTNTGNFYNESWNFNENDGALKCNFSYTDSIFTNMQLVDLPTTLTTTFNTVAIEVPYNTGMKTFPLSKSYSIENGVITDAAGFAAEMIVTKAQLTSPGVSNYFNFELRNNSTKILSIVKYSYVENFYKATSWTFDVFESKSSGCWQSTDATNCVSKTATSISSNTKFNYSVSDITDADIATGAITRYISVGYINNCGGATTHTEYCVSLQKATNIPATPLIATRRDEELGTVVFLSFSGAFDDGVTISPIRLNTLFAKELINKANVSIDDLLAWDTQLTLEPAMTSGASPTPMDFYGANGLYFWELFFYMPWLVASRLSQEGNYADAQKWFNYIFDPSAYGRANSNADYPEPDYWSVRPLVEANAQESLAALILNPDDPDIIAKADPVHYQKAIAMAYLANLIAAGDADYRLLTNDGLAQAKLRYVQVKTLLGSRPDISTLQQWQPDTLENIASQRNTDLTALENSASISLYAFAGSSTLAQDVTINDAFSLPLNAQLLNYWDVIDSRLYNLRHNLSITGQPINIPLYATPVNPALLVQMNATGGSLSGQASTLSMTIPPYRFAAMLQHARGAVGTLSQMGQTLLSYYERKESTGLQELQQQQALDLSAFTISLQKQAIDALKADQKALEASKDIAQQRYDYYYDLYTTGISASEQEVMNMQSSASALFTTAEPFLTAGAALNMAPNIFGLADGGAVWGAALTASGMVLQLSANSVQGTAQRIQVSEEYRRRSEEWKQQYSRRMPRWPALTGNWMRLRYVSRRPRPRCSRYRPSRQICRPRCNTSPADSRNRRYIAGLSANWRRFTTRHTTRCCRCA